MLHSVYLSARLSLPETLVTFELTIFSFFPLRYFCSIIFYSCKKVGGGGGLKLPPAPPSARSLTREIEKVYVEKKKPRGVAVQEYFGFCYRRWAGYGFYYLALQREHLVRPEATYRKRSNKRFLSNKRPPHAVNPHPTNWGPIGPRVIISIYHNSHGWTIFSRFQQFVSMC